MAEPTARHLSYPRLALAVAAGLGSAATIRSYRRDLAAAHDRLQAVARRVVDTPFGAVEYAERGAGEPLLVSHGIFHGCDGGLLSVADTVVGRRVIVPSRFGYLGSAFPPEATTGDQADAFVAVLDSLGVTTVDVLAISAGTSAAIQLVLRHPERVHHLVISSGNLPGSATATAPPGWAKAFYSDPAMWVMKKVARPAFARLMGVPAGFPRDEADASVMARMLDSIFPVGPRAKGAVFDAFVANPEVNRYPLDRIGVPVLLVHSVDDPLASYQAAASAAEQIPNARLVTLDSGGHLQLGQTDRVRGAVEDFLSG